MGSFEDREGPHRLNQYLSENMATTVMNMEKIILRIVGNGPGEESQSGDSAPTE